MRKEPENSFTPLSADRLAVYHTGATLPREFADGYFTEIFEQEITSSPVSLAELPGVSEPGPTFEQDIQHLNELVLAQQEEQGEALSVADTVKLESPRRPRQKSLYEGGARYLMVARNPGFESKGAMSTVRRGYDRKLQRLVAIKVMDKALGMSSEDLLKILELEAKVMAQVNNPGFAYIYDFIRDDERKKAYLIMEYFRGLTLGEFLSLNRRTNVQIPLPEVTQILSLLTKSMLFLEKHKVIHRDIKPDNMFVKWEGEPTASPVERVALFDFGISNVVIDGIGFPRNKNLNYGTPSYMAPENFDAILPNPQANNLYELSLLCREDVFTLGLITYELFNKTPLIPDILESVSDYLESAQKEFRMAANFAQLLEADYNKIIKEEVSQSRVPQCLVPVVTRALLKSPAQRYASPVDFMEAFKAAK